MARLKRVKRRVLRQLVRENVDLLAGRLPRRRSRWLGHAVRASKMIFLVGLPLALFGSSYFLSAVAAAWFALDQWFPWIFEVRTSCGYTPFVLFQITLAEVLMVITVLLALLSAALFVASFFERRIQ